MHHTLKPIFSLQYHSKILAANFLVFVSLLVAAFPVSAAYVFQTVPQEAFDNVTTNVVWTNDPSQTGYPTDDDYQLVNIGFTFYLGETGYNQVRVLANGALHFGADQGFHKYYVNEALPITGSFNGPGFEEPADRVISGYWDDLEPSLAGTVRYGTLGSAPNRRFVASWQGVPRYNGFGTSHSFQIVIYENGNVKFRYGNDLANGSSATIGIEVDNNDFTQYSYNTASVNDLLDILWVREFPAINTVLADCLTSDKVTITFGSAISPARAADPSNFTIDNGVNVISAAYINATTVELTTSPLLTGLTYTLTTTYPNQSQTFQLGTLATITYIDYFTNTGYNNNNGTGNWSTPWIESFDNNSANSGRVFISSGELFMNDFPNSGNTPQLEREVSLVGITSAILTFDYRTSNTLENSDRFDIAVSSNGGVTYTILETFSDDVSGSASYDITSFIALNTKIRFRIESNYGASNEFMAIDNVNITTQRVESCTPQVDHFVITHDNNGINCLREAINITAVDSSDNPVTQYAGTINLSLLTNHGNWFTLNESGNSSDPAQGTLTDTAGDNNGVATYEFNVVDAGSVTLYLENTVREVTNINITEGITTDDNSEGDITFRPFGFIASPSPVQTQVAGKPFNITLTAAGQTPSQPNCGVIEEYTGNQSLNLWSTYSSPNMGTVPVSVNGSTIALNEATSSAQNVTFTNGISNLSVQYDDVGSIFISAKDETGIGNPTNGNIDEIIGGVSPFVVRPFGYDIRISGTPYADDANDSVYTIAGQSFPMTLRSVIWEADDDVNNDSIPDPFIDSNADGIPDSGRDLSNNAVTPNISLISGAISLTPQALVVTNSNGNILINTINFNSFAGSGSPQQATTTLDQRWTETGILQLDAVTTNFMGSGENITGQRINIGRFIPASFNMVINTINEQCGNFSYAGFYDGTNAGLDRSGQPFEVTGTIVAVNTNNNTTLNYHGAFAKLTNNNFAAQAFNASTSSNDTGRINFSPAALNFNNGVTNYADLTTDYQYANLANLFNLQINLTATDPDSVTSGVIGSNTIEIRLGRLRLTDAYGPETSDLEIPITSDYFNGSSWISNTADNCTTYIDTDAIFEAGSYTDNLNSGETSTFAPTIIPQTLNAGSSDLGNGLWFSASGAGNFGSVNVQFDLSSQPWLRFDWDQDNTLDFSDAKLNFGYYRGNDRVIYWREIGN